MSQDENSNNNHTDPWDDTTSHHEHVNTTKNPFMTKDNNDYSRFGHDGDNNHESTHQIVMTKAKATIDKIPIMKDYEDNIFDREPQITVKDSPDGHTNDSAIASSEFAMQQPKNPHETSTTAAATTGTALLKENDQPGKFAISDWMNDNLLVVRYGLMASIGLLTAYGISQSPLLFRYRKVSEIPTKFFLERRILHCQLVSYEMTTRTNNNNNAKRMTLWCRHLSLAERLLRPTGFWPPNQQNNTTTTTRTGPSKDCIPIQLVGIESPEILSNDSEKATKQSYTTGTSGSLLQFISNSTNRMQDQQLMEETAIRNPTIAATSTATKPLDFMEDLIKRSTLISCQLMARGVVVADTPLLTSNQNNNSNSSTKKRPIPGLVTSVDDDNPTTKSSSEQMAFGKIWYRPKGPLQIFATDLGRHLVERGEAVVATDLYGLHPGLTIVDHTAATATRGTAGTSMKQLRQDVTYVSKTLADAEIRACRNARGVWKNELYRRQRQDFVDDVEFWEQASWPRKLWRWIRGG